MKAVFHDSMEARKAIDKGQRRTSFQKYDNNRFGISAHDQSHGLKNVRDIKRCIVCKKGWNLGLELGA